MERPINLSVSVRLCACVAVLFLLGSCVSSQSLVKRTDERLSSCLRVGMTLDAAEICTQKADLVFFDLKRPPGVRAYRNSAPDVWPVTYSVVLTELHFSQSGELVSWSSKGSYDGI